MIHSSLPPAAMETALVLDSRSPQLGLQFKKRFEHSSDVQVRWSSR